MTWIKKGIIFNKEWAQLPVVDKLPGLYKIYYSTRDEQGRSIPKCFCLPDDLEWDVFSDNIKQPNIPLGKPGSFDSHGIMPSSIITLEDGTKYMYYVGWSKRIDVPYWNSTGLAISKDGGVTWEKYSDSPVFIGQDGDFIGTVNVSKSNGYYYLSYSSCNWENVENKWEPVYGIKSVTSSQLDNLVKWDWTSFDHLKLKKNEGGIAAFRNLKDKYYYSKRNKSDYRTNIKNSYKIYSKDIATGKETLELSPSGDEIMCAYPFIIEEKDKYIMFYNSDFGKSGISYAIKNKNG